MNDGERRAALVAAETRALALFDAIEAGGLIAPGRTERQVEDDIAALAERDFGVSRHWHRRLVRAGPNTLAISSDHPAARTIEADDTVYVDLGPVVEDWEADIGRSYALGDSADKRRLVADLPRVFERVQDHYHASPDITGAALFDFAVQAADEAGWAFGGQIAGHLIGEFPHARWPGDRERMRIWPAHTEPMRGKDHRGRALNWILEIHLVDRARTFGGFYERLL